jgi:hypothetical protein
MQSYKVHVLAVLKHNKEFILDLKGSKSQLKDLCVDQLNVREEDFNDIIKVMENGECYESDADSDGDLKLVFTTYLHFHRIFKHVHYAEVSLVVMRMRP